MSLTEKMSIEEWVFEFAGFVYVHTDCEWSTFHEMYS